MEIIIYKYEIKAININAGSCAFVTSCYLLVSCNKLDDRDFIKGLQVQSLALWQTW